MNELMNLRDKRVQTWNAAKAFLESHRGTDGTLSAEDDAIFNKMMDEVDKLGKEVMRLEKLEALDEERLADEGNRRDGYAGLPSPAGLGRHTGAGKEKAPAALH